MTSLPTNVALGTAPPKLPDLSVWTLSAGSLVADMALLDRRLTDLFDTACAADPAAPALITPRQTVSYAALRQRAIAIAHQVAAAVSANTPVAVATGRVADWPIALLGALGSGRTVILAGAGQPNERERVILQDSGAGCVVVDDAAVGRILKSGLPLVITGDDGTPEQAQWPPPRDQDGPGVVLYTSGSTGKPKGVVCSERQMVGRALRHIGSLGIAPRDRIMPLGQVAASAGATQVLAGILSGAALCLRETGDGLHGLSEFVCTCQVSLLYAVPSVLRAIAALPDASNTFAMISRVYLTGERLLARDHAMWRPLLPADCEVTVSYSLSEAAPIASMQLPRDLSAADPSVPVGRPAAGIAWVILDDALRRVEDGEAGEMWVRSPYFSLGEWRAGRCMPGLIDSTPHDGGWPILRTGDVVRARPDGVLLHLGRRDGQVKINGNRVEPAAIEAALRDLPGVADAAVASDASADPPRLVAVVAPLDLAAGEAFRRSLSASLRSTLPAWHQPSELRLVTSVPRLATGKADRQAILSLSTAPRQSRTAGALVDRLLGRRR